MNLESLSHFFGSLHKNQSPPNKSLKQTPRAGQKTQGGSLRRCLAQSRYAAFLTGWLIPELANNVYTELSL